MRPTLTGLLLVCLAGAAGAGEPVRVANADALRGALRAAAAGSVILIEPGDYRGYFSGANLHGTPEKPIVIGGADPARPPVLHGASECLHLSSVSHLILRDLVLTGSRVNGLNIDDGGTIDAPSHHLVLDGLAVRDIGSSDNHDGIKLSGIEDFLVRRCTIERWGGGGSAIDMVGCHRGLILDSTFRHDAGKGSNAVQAKGGSCDVVIGRCRFANAGQRAINMGGSTGLAYFRPRKPGYEARRIVAIGNTFVGSMAPVAFVGSDDCVASYNTLCRPGAWAARILQETRGPDFAPSRNGVFRGNIVVWRWRELRTAANVGPDTAPETFRFEGNWWFCEDRPGGSQPSLPVPEANGVVGRDPGLRVDERGVAGGPPGYGADSKQAAEELARIAPKLAPWATDQARERKTLNSP